MFIDLNIVPGQHEELLPDVNEKPAHEEDELTQLQEDQVYEHEAQLPDQHGELLPNLNGEPANEQEDGIAHDQQNQLYAAEAHLQGQPLHLHNNKRLGVHVIDLNVLASDSEQEHYEVVRGEEEHPQDACVNFGGPLKFDLTFDPSDLQRQMHQVHSMMEDSDDYSVHDDAMDIVFNAEELDDLDVDEDDNIEVSGQQQEMQQVINMMDNMHEYDVYANAVEVDFDQEELEDSDVEDHHHGTKKNARPYRNLTNAERQQIYEALLERSNHGRLKRKTTTIVAQLFKVSRYRVQRIWQRAKQCRAQGMPVDIRSRMPKKYGRKKMQVDLSVIRSVPLHKRTTIRSLAKAIGVHRSTLHKWFKEGLLRRHSSTLKPLLRGKNKRERLKWCVSMLDERTLPNEPRFKEMYNIIHMDEKWFNTTSDNMTYYMLPDEEDPHRTLQNKNFIGKIMFLTAVGRPMFDDLGNCIFDGKIGLWPFVRKEGAKRRSHNRGREAQVTKPIKVDRTTMRSYLIGHVLKAIVRRWPRERRGETIWIQQDNAPSHVLVNDKEFAAAVKQTGLDIRLMNQPANSPDLNVLDLGFFSSLQSLAYETISTSLDELIENVKREFDNYDPDTLNRVFLTLQGCMIEVMKDGGGNRYKIPHMDKDRLEALGMLPKSLSCDRELYESVMNTLASNADNE